MGVRGDGFKGLKDLRRRMAAIGKPEFRRELSANMGEEARTQVHEGFRREVAPDDTPWKPSTSPNTLRDSARLMNSIGVQAYTRGFALATNAKYAAIHQYGGVIKAKKARKGGRKPMLVFKVKTGSRIGPQGSKKSRALEALGRGTGFKRLKTPQTTYRWVQVPQVTIPPRPFIPEGQLGPRWVRALDAAATKTMLAQMGNDF
jgi:phage gpG-like protein